MYDTGASGSEASAHRCGAPFKKALESHLGGSILVDSSHKNYCYTQPPIETIVQLTQEPESAE